MAIPACREVRIALFKNVIPYLPLYYVITRKEETIPDLGKVIFCRPEPPCVITCQTKITFVRYCKHEITTRVGSEELKHNVIVWLDYGEGERKFYIYPKAVFEHVKFKYIDPMLEGKPPIEPGLLLYGPRGTGKTSLIEILADTLGLYVVRIDTTILSKYVGESEQRLLERLTEAEENEPALVNMDEQDYLVRRRDITGGGSDSGTLTYQALLSILLTKMPQYKREKRRLLIVLATNLSPSCIDEALLRHERFGKPVYVPLPDSEAIYWMLKLNKVDEILGETKVVELARQLASIGITMADLKDLIDYIKEKHQVPDLSHYSLFERGYKRIYPSRIVKLEPSQLLDRLRSFTEGRTRLWIRIPSDLGEAIAVMALANLGIPPVVLTDPRYVDEAILTAESCKGVLIVPSDYIPQDVQILIHNVAKCPVWYVGDGCAVKSVVYLDIESTSTRIPKDKLLEIVCAYKGIEYDSTAIKRLAQVSDYHFEMILRELLVRKVSNIREIAKEKGIIV